MKRTISISDNALLDNYRRAVHDALENDLDSSTMLYKAKLFNELSERGLEPECVAIWLTEDLRNTISFDIASLLKVLERSRESGDLSSFYNEVGDPITDEAMILDDFFEILESAFKLAKATEMKNGNYIPLSEIEKQCVGYR